MKTIFTASLLGLAMIVAMAGVPGTAHSGGPGDVATVTLLGSADAQSHDLSLAKFSFGFSRGSYGGHYGYSPYWNNDRYLNSPNYVYGDSQYYQYNNSKPQVCTWNGYEYVCDRTYGY